MFRLTGRVPAFYCIEMKTVLITGASSGIGFDAAQALAKAGYKVFAGARRVERMEPLKALGITPVALDVTSEESIDACLALVGPVDVLVNCAGYGSFGPIEAVSLEEGRRQMEVNLFGLAALCKKVLPGMRERREGRIVNISSVCGRASLYLGGWYNVSKYAVEAFSDALRIEMAPFGVKVVLIEPGATRTNWGFITADNLEACGSGTAYEESTLAAASMIRKMFGTSLFSHPSVVTRAICRAVRARRPRTRYVVAAGSWSMVFWHAVLPTRMWDAIVRQLGSPRLASFVEKL